jgi:uncharacterized iron-regulated membrane protein
MREAIAIRPDRSLYQAVWRWHFIAGLLVMPFLVMMAITGGLYLFKDEITHAVYRSMIDVPARATPWAPASLLIRNTEAVLDGPVLQFSAPAGPRQSASMIVRAPSGEALTAYADPYDGHFLGSTPYGGVMQTIRKIHSLQRFGFWASCLIEIAAGWAIMLVGTGLYMWWPRGRKGGVVSVRGDPRQRVFWRDVHAVTGAFVGLVILFLAATGMPWSLFWGVKVQTWVGRHHLYAPAAPAFTQREEVMGITVPPTPAARALNGELPWTMQMAKAPTSAAPVGAVMPGMPGMEAAPTTHTDADPRTPIGVDRALAAFRKMGVEGSFGLALPMGPKGAYVANYRPMKVENTRTIYLDQYTGKVLGDVRYRDWFAGGKAIEWGTGVHMGREYGAVNRYVMLAGCIGMVLLAISSFTMWWKRRPQGKLGLPAAPDDPRIARALLGVMIPVGLVFPLVGLSMIVALALELLFQVVRRPSWVEA